MSQSRIWVPPSARTFAPEVEAVLADHPEWRSVAADMEDQGVKLADPGPRQPGSMVILIAEEWVEINTPRYGPVVCAVIRDEAVERMILDNTLDYVNAGIVLEAEKLIMQAMCPGVRFELKQFQTITSLEHPQVPYPRDWRADAVRVGLGYAIPYQGDYAWFCTGPFRNLGGLIPIVDGARAKLGRNDRCSCGSGLKFKRCCGK